MFPSVLTRLNTEEQQMTPEEFLYELQKQTLNELRPYLGKHLDPEKLFPWLQSKNVLSVDDCESIRSKETTSKKVGALIDILIKAGPGGMQQLIKAIKKACKSQTFVAVKLEICYEELKNDAENQKKLQMIKHPNSNRHHNERTRTPPPPYPGIEEPFTWRPCPQTSPPDQPGPHYPSKPLENQPVREPVISEWPPACLSPSVGDSYFSTQNFEQETRAGISTFSASDLSANSLQTCPTYISEQVEKLSRYGNPNNLAIQERKVRAFSDPVTPRRQTSSNDADVTESFMSSVVFDQDVEFSKAQAHMKMLTEGRRSPLHRPRTPNEHETTSSMMSTDVKQLYLPPGEGPMVTFSSDSEPVQNGLARLNLSGYRSDPHGHPCFTH